MYFDYYKLLFNNKIEFKRFNYREIHIAYIQVPI
jgi:hypothetical protein